MPRADCMVGAIVAIGEFAIRAVRPPGIGHATDAQAIPGGTREEDGCHEGAARQSYARTNGPDYCGAPLEKPVARQAGAILEHRLAERRRYSGQCRAWVFPSGSSSSGRLHRLQHLNARIGEAGGARFWFCALRRCFVAVADDELALPAGLAARLAGAAPPRELSSAHTAEWTMEELREGAQRIVDRMDEPAVP